MSTMWDKGIRNVLALRGDPQAGQANFVPTEGGFTYADELVGFVKSRREFCIGVAGYPEGHPQCLNRTRDLENLKRKVDNGGCFIITQLFFDNADFYRFVEHARHMGIKVPIIAGIMPILNVGQIKRVITMCGRRSPPRVLKRDVEGGPDAVHAAVFEYATRQCQTCVPRVDDQLLHAEQGNARADLQSWALSTRVEPPLDRENHASPCSDSARHPPQRLRPRPAF